MIKSQDKFKIDYQVLTFEPPPEPRPESPVEKLQADKFTVLQLLNLGRQFQQIAPGGFVSHREFIESIQRVVTQSPGMDLLPEAFTTSESSQMQQICNIFDPFETGFLNWQRYILVSAKILPTPSAEYMAYLKNQFINCESYSDGKVSEADFSSISFWFEEDEGDSSSEVKFNRSAKLKQAIFHLFSSRNQKADDESDEADQVAHRIQGELALDLGRNAEVEKPTSAPTQSLTQSPGTPAEGNSRPHTAKHTIGTGATFLMEHEKPASVANVTFDVSKFMLMSSLDESSRAGFQKAFAVISSREDNSVTPTELFYIANFWFFLVPDSHRDSDHPSIFSLVMHKLTYRN